MKKVKQTDNTLLTLFDDINNVLEELKTILKKNKKELENFNKELKGKV